MTTTEILINQTSNAYEWTNKLLEAVPLDKWEILPETIESSINWQVGHLIVSHYFNSIMAIKGHQMDILQKLPVKDYSELFTTALPKDSVGKFLPEKLLQDLKVMQQKSIAILSLLTDDDLNNPLEPTPTPNPIASTKFEAIDWNIKHTLYHCGQIGMISRVVAKRYDFGLQVAR